MARTNLALLFRSRIANQDGWSGRLVGVFLAPRTGQATHVLAKGGFFSKPLTLALSGAQSREDGALLLAQGAQGQPPGRGSVRLTAITPVSLGGRSVPLQGLILDWRTGAPRYILVRHAGDIRALRHEQVQNLTSGSPTARLTPEEIAALPVYRPDAQTGRNAADALQAVDSWSGNYAAVKMQVVEGAVYLSGNVQLPVQKEEAESAVRRAKGVLAVQNHIITDWDLRIAIAEALAKKGVTRDGYVSVRSVLGVVNLLGHLSCQVHLDNALQITRAVPGVRSVGSYLQLDATAPEGEPARAVVEPPSPTP
ncbi:MAG: BON domain-containing protein [Chloroflexi bacterium]|nr:BON domain-containing protein [Chloroflexota bacterium]